MAPSKWRFIGLMHNLPLEHAVDTENMAAVPLTDPRLQADMASRDFKHFVTAFKDQFGRRRRPSALLAKGSVRSKPGAVLAFRNALAVSAITRAWEASLGADRQLEFLKYSGYFDLYPHYLSHDYSSLILLSPSVRSIDETEEFSGQTAPELAPASLRKDFYDDDLLAALMTSWRRRYVRGHRSTVADEALFRSLEMAYRAARVPSDNRGSLDDYGASLALWCSAMEILVWPGHSRATATDVLAALRPATACSPRLRRRRYMARVPGSGPRHVTLMEKLYCEMHQARNAFLHGNPVTAGTVHPSGHRTRRSLLCYAPILYKCALYTTLGLWESTHPVLSPEAARHRIFLSFTANALFTSTKPYETHRDRRARQARLRERRRRRPT